MAAKSTKQSVNKKAITKKPPKRTTAKVFDLLFKELLHLSNRAVVSFINGLFGSKYLLDSKIVYLEQEIVNENLDDLIRDTVLKINGITYHIEAQINFDTDMMIRIFRYGFEAGVLQKKNTGNIRTIEFPQTRIIYFEGSKKTPKQQILHLKFPDHSCYDYKVDIFSLLNYRIDELENQGLALLLPFYVLKMRRQVQKAKSGEELEKLSKPLKALLEELLSAVDSSKSKGNIDEDDVPSLINGLERLYSELFSQYDELAEGDIMLSEKLDTYLDRKTRGIEANGEKRGEKKAMLKVAKRLLADGMSASKVAKTTELPLETIQDLQKKPKGKSKVA